MALNYLLLLVIVAYTQLCHLPDYLHCVQKKTLTDIFFYISAKNA